MVIDLAQLFTLQPLLLFFAVLASGYALSKLSLRQVHLSAPVGVLVAGMVFGHFGFKAPPMIQEIGFTLFIYSVGLTAGPRFFNILLADGARYLALTVAVALLAAATALGMGRLYGFGAPTSAGMLAGTLTSSPTLMAAQEALVASHPDSQTILAQMGSAYALTYLVGLFSILALIRFAPLVLRTDLAKESLSLSRERRYREDPDDLEPAFAPPQLRAFQVERPEAAGQPFERSALCHGGRCALQAVKRGELVFRPEPGALLEAGDLVALSMPVGLAPQAVERIGREVFDTDLLSDVIDTADIIVTNPEVAGRPLEELTVLSRQGCTPVRLVRSHIPIAPRPGIVLEKGDLLTVAGLKHRLEGVVRAVGYVERSMVETDLIAFVCGVLLGLWLGALKFKLGDVTLGLGQAGGLLVAGLVFGFARSAAPSFGQVPPPARWLLAELGLIFFMACVGLKAGEGVLDALRNSGAELLVSAVAISGVSLFGGLLFGRFALRMNPALLFGAMAGAMTSTPALKVVTQNARSSLPALGYAGTYTFANVLLALLGSLLARM